jgi:multiple sugar transport system permease protein
VKKTGLIRFNNLSSIRAWLYIAPAALIVLGAGLYPLLRSIVTSFTDQLFTYTNFDWIGLANYFTILKDPLFWRALWNSLQLVFWNVSITLVIGLAIALLLHSKIKARNWFRALLFLPWAVPTIVNTLMFRWLYNDIYGYPNYILQKLGLISQAINPLAHTTTAMAAVLAPVVWNYFPFVMLMALSAMQSINRSLYEAAAMDGAGRWQTFRYVTWPALKPVLVIVTVLQALWTFAEFGLVYLMNGGGPANSTLTLSLYIYRKGFEYKQLGYASALGVATFLILIALTLLFFQLSRKTRLYEN